LPLCARASGPTSVQLRCSAKLTLLFNDFKDRGHGTIGNVHRQGAALRFADAGRKFHVKHSAA
jgi:hypothetical protein